MESVSAPAECKCAVSGTCRGPPHFGWQLSPAGDPDSGLLPLCRMMDRPGGTGTWPRLRRGGARLGLLHMSSGTSQIYLTFYAKGPTALAYGITISEQLCSFTDRGMPNLQAKSSSSSCIVYFLGMLHDFGISLSVTPCQHNLCQPSRRTLSFSQAATESSLSTTRLSLQASIARYHFLPTALSSGYILTRSTNYSLGHSPLSCTITHLNHSYSLLHPSFPSLLASPLALRTLPCSPPSP